MKIFTEASIGFVLTFKQNNKYPAVRCHTGMNLCLHIFVYISLRLSLWQRLVWPSANWVDSLHTGIMESAGDHRQLVVCLLMVKEPWILGIVFSRFSLALWKCSNVRFQFFPQFWKIPSEEFLVNSFLQINQRDRNNESIKHHSNLSLR